MKKHIFLSVLSIFLISCKTRQATTKEAQPKVSTTSFFKEMKKEQTFEQLKINSQISVDMGRFIPMIDATIYIEKDKKVWLNAAAIFINVARGVATEDGIKGYEKWNKTYIESDFSYLNNLLNVDFINYKAFQSLLIGRTFVPVNEADFILDETPSGFSLKTKNLQKIKDSDYQMNLEYSSALDLKKIEVREVSGKGNQLEVYYENWADYGSLRLPKTVKIIIKGEKNGQIRIENTKFDFNKMETPYSVPSNYTKIEIK